MYYGYYGYGYGYGAAFIGMLVVFILISLAFYALYSFGFYTIAVRSNIPNAILAWIPVAQLYLLGMIMKELYLGNSKIPSLHIILPCLWGLNFLTYLFLWILPGLGWFFNLIFVVAMILVHIQFFKRMQDPNAILLGIFYPIGMFVNRNRTYYVQ